MSEREILSLEDKCFARARCRRRPLPVSPAAVRDLGEPSRVGGLSWIG
jgi:hypothetical protein